MDLTDPIREYIYQKLSALEKVAGDTENINIFVEVGRESNHHNKGEDVFLAEFRMRFAGKDYYVKNFNADLYAAIDITKDDLIRDIKADKKKGQTLFIRGARSLKKRIKGMKPWWPFGGKN